MKISVFPKGELDAIVLHKTLTPEAWIGQAADLPIEGVELYAPFFPAGDQDQVSRIGEALAQHELVMPMLCVSPDFTHPDAEERARQFDEHVRIMEIASVLGGPGVSVRVLSGQRHPEVSVEQGIDLVVDSFQRLIPIAKELDVVLGFENHYKDGYWNYPEFAQRGEVYLAILNQIEERVHFGVQFDPSNAVTAGMDSSEFLEQVVGRVVTMQASDRYLAEGASLDNLRLADGTIGYSPDLRHGVIGQGLNDYPRIFTILNQAGYDGWISIEDGVNGWGEMRESVDFLVAARETHFGGSKDVRVATHEQARNDARDAQEKDA